MSDVEDHRDLLDEARKLEQRRVEITMMACDLRIADLLPETWARMNEWQAEELIPVSFVTGLHAVDGERMTERECRNFVAWVGQMADQRRRRDPIEESDE